MSKALCLLGLKPVPKILPTTLNILTEKEGGSDIGTGAGIGTGTGTGTGVEIVNDADNKGGIVGQNEILIPDRDKFSSGMNFYYFLLT